MDKLKQTWSKSPNFEMLVKDMDEFQFNYQLIAELVSLSKDYLVNC